jgi:acyl carrier protein
LNTEKEVLSLLEQTLNLKGRSVEFNVNTALLGAIPELDSMAVVELITRLEERFGFFVDDDEIEGSTFATVGSLVKFVDSKLAS